MYVIHAGTACVHVLSISQWLPQFTRLAIAASMQPSLLRTTNYSLNQTFDPLFASSRTLSCLLFPFSSLQPQHDYHEPNMRLQALESRERQVN